VQVLEARPLVVISTLGLLQWFDTFGWLTGRAIPDLIGFRHSALSSFHLV